MRKEMEIPSDMEFLTPPMEHESVQPKILSSAPHSISLTADFASANFIAPLKSKIAQLAQLTVNVIVIAGRTLNCWHLNWGADENLHNHNSDFNAVSTERNIQVQLSIALPKSKSTTL